MLVQGYFLGAWMYLGIIFTLPLGLGVLALALDLPLSTNEALEGLVMPASAYVLLGKGGVSHKRPSELWAVIWLGLADVSRRVCKMRLAGR